MMSAPIAIVWSIGLAGALVPAIFIFRSGRLLIRTLEDLLALSRTIARAAHGIERNVSVIPTLPDLRPVAAQFADLTSAVERSFTSVARSAEALRGLR